jgi:pseudaminic acid cytidylyltransferase
MRLAVIPARGGSKRIPRKNIRPFCGKPMIAWSIEAARASACFDRIIVSTDDDEIADTASFFGAEIPFRRPAELSDDHTGTLAVIAHAVRWQGDNGAEPTEVCCIYATAPFVEPGDLRHGLERLEAQRCDYVFSATHYPFPVQRAFRMTPQGRAEMVYPEHFGTRSQDLEELFHDAGQFYWGTSSAWLDQRPIFSAGASPLLLPRHRVQDIDTPDDWTRAEAMFRALRDAT